MEPCGRLEASIAQGFCDLLDAILLTNKAGYRLAVGAGGAARQQDKG